MNGIHAKKRERAGNSRISLRLVPNISRLGILTVFQSVSKRAKLFPWVTNGCLKGVDGMAVSLAATLICHPRPFLLCRVNEGF